MSMIDFLVSAFLWIIGISFVLVFGAYFLEIIKGNVNPSRGTTNNITINKNIFIVPKKDNPNQ